MSWTTDTLQLRLMLDADLLDYKALRDGMLARHPEAFTSDAETESARDVASYRSRLAGGGDGETLFTLIARDGARLLGALTVEREPRRKVQHIAHLIGMMVAPEARGRGVGGRLLDQAIALLKADTSLELVTLSVTRGNGPAVTLYASRGFERYGRLERALKLADGRVLDKDLMRLVLR